MLHSCSLSQGVHGQQWERPARERDTQGFPGEGCGVLQCAAALFSVLFTVPGCNQELRLREQHVSPATGVQHCS